MLLTFSLGWFYFLPSSGLIMLSLSVGICIWLLFKKNIKLALSLSISLTIVTFLTLENYAMIREAESLIHEIFEYNKSNGITPRTLEQLETAKIKRSLSLYNYRYQRRIVSETNFKWKFEFKSLWGTQHWYCDKTGDIESENDHPIGLHWVEFDRR